MIRESVTPTHVKLYKAMLVLASEDCPIQERVLHAYVRYLRDIDLDVLRPAVRERLAVAIGELEQCFREGNILSLDANTAATLAMQIVVLYDESTRP